MSQIAYAFLQNKLELDKERVKQIVEDRRMITANSGLWKGSAEQRSLYHKTIGTVFSYVSREGDRKRETNREELRKIQ